MNNNITHRVISYDHPPNVEAIVLVVDGVEAILPVGIPILNTELFHDDNDETVRITIWFDSGVEMCVTKSLASVGVDQEWNISMSVDHLLELYDS